MYYSLIITPAGLAPAIESIFPTHETDTAASTFGDRDLAVMMASIQATRRGALGWVVSEWDGQAGQWHPVASHIEADL